jgi:hypothetical protein
MEPYTANEAPSLVFMNYFGPVKSSHLLQAAQKKMEILKQNIGVHFYNVSFTQCTIVQFQESAVPVSGRSLINCLT